MAWLWFNLTDGRQRAHDSGLDASMHTLKRACACVPDVSPHVLPHPSHISPPTPQVVKNSVWAATVVLPNKERRHPQRTVSMWHDKASKFAGAGITVTQ